MASLSFNTPKTATLQQYVVSGTIPAGITLEQAVQMLVTRADNSTEGYYFAFSPQYSTADQLFTETVLMPIIPKLSGTAVATAYLGQDIDGWIIQA